jgi:hypothetical protein
MLDRDDPEEYGWMRDVLDKCPGVYKRCDLDTRHEFVQRIQGFPKEKLSQECQRIFDDIGKLVGAKRLPPAPDSEQSSASDSDEVQP